MFNRFPQAILLTPRLKPKGNVTPSPRRFIKPGYVYHLVARGNNKQVIFRGSEDFQKYLYLLEDARKKFSVLIYNYVLMDNHVHLLVEPREERSVSKAMEHIGKSYAQYFNHKYEHVGHVFQGRFKSFMILDEWYFFACTRYIDLNPVKAGVVNDPKDYVWAGYPTLGYGRRGIVELDPHDLYRRLAADPGIRQSVYRSMILGNHHENLDLLNRRAGSLKR